MLHTRGGQEWSYGLGEDGLESRAPPTVVAVHDLARRADDLLRHWRRHRTSVARTV